MTNYVVEQICLNYC